MEMVSFDSTKATLYNPLYDVERATQVKNDLRLLKFKGGCQKAISR